MPQPQNQDPYAPPPMHHDRSGAVVRIAIVAALIGAAAWGYTSFRNQPQTALVPEVAQEQQMAANYPPPATLPEATSESLVEAAPAPTPAPARRAAPERAPAPATTPVPTEPAPPPAVTPAPAPIPPMDLPPAA